MVITGLGGPEEDHQLHHCCWTGRVSEREEEKEEDLQQVNITHVVQLNCTSNQLQFSVNQSAPSLMFPEQRFLCFIFHY